MKPTLECVVIVPKVYQDYNCPGLFQPEKETHLRQSYLALVVNKSKLWQFKWRKDYDRPCLKWNHP
jgi:hypothetical protein